MGVEGRGKRVRLREDRGAWDGKQGVRWEIGRSERSMKAWDGKMGSGLFSSLLFLRLPAAYVYPSWLFFKCCVVCEN